MRLPTEMPEGAEDRRILGEFYDLHVKKQWFDMALLIVNHPQQMRKTLVVYVNYNPAFEQKDILAFTHKYNLGLQIISNQNQE